MATQVPTGSTIAVKKYSVGLFAASQQQASFRKNMRGPMPKQADAEAKLKGQSAPGMPFIQCTDLSKTAGEKISVDMFNIISGKPVMGDRRAKGTGVALNFSSMEATINQYRKVVDRGGNMAQKRTEHDLRGIAAATLMNWFNRYEDQSCLCHVAGARGTQNDLQWVIPLASDPDFAEIMVNTIKAPTFNRHYVADSTSIVKGGQQLASIDTGDIMRLEHIDALRKLIDNMEFPMQPVSLAGDPAAADEPLYVFYVTPSQYSDLITNTSGNVLRTFQQNAWNRASSFKEKHPLFAGEVGMWNNILVKKQGRQVIRYITGDLAPHITSANEATATETNATIPTLTGFCVERAILMGAQALIDVYGKQSQSGYYYAWLEEKTDFDNGLEICAAGMGGKAKVRFSYPDVSGTAKPTDHGVLVFDTAAALQS